MNQKTSHFFAHLARMKLIYRWPLMRNVVNENISEHSLQVAFVAHALALIGNKKFNANIIPERVALLAMFHDCSEVLTGDLPTPIKYFNPAIADEYKKIERIAEAKLVSMLPEEFRDDYRLLIDSKIIDKDYYQIVKQADAICAYFKCLEELSAGNHEFKQAKRRLEKTMRDRRSAASEYFMTTFASSFMLSLDEMNDEQ
ncbi:5'-deoxynucleotidase [Candidatus Enterovibrio altilux]|uniref:5'-deoxynucleotidase n=1 Tax=Candidatus Enterovibrio altilux TaxID=1927128 RepID=A0A291B9X4_9GAMM|nr:5'-deoxynucleotidase [Candidatus Enterovibrio luxaltus]ATF09784.1 Nucleotidase YfbR, HD superfamily [Candidatus Enterovibrio luxaltus]